MVLQIRAKLSDVARIGATWEGPPMAPGRVATVTDFFGNYPSWRKNFDHDGDPSTPPRDFGPHKGYDLVNPAPYEYIVAADDGVVFWVQRGHEVSGNYVIVTHYTNEANGAPVPATYYLHLNEILVVTGQMVRAGEPIGIEGATGAVTGRHCHFGVRLGDHYVDPVQYLVDPSTPAPPPPFEPMPSGKFTLSYYVSGGTLDEFEAALRSVGAEAAYITKKGVWAAFHVGAPDWINEDFAAEYPNGLPPGTAVMIGDLK